jgi:hypothetical protein
MAPPAVITKATGHVSTVSLAGDLRYLDETTSRGNWEFKQLTPEEIKHLVGKKRRLFSAQQGGPIIRIPAEIIPVLDRRGVMRGRKTGIISDPYAARAEGLHTMGNIIYQRIVTGVKALDPGHGFSLAREHGTIVPLTWTAQIKAQEMQWSASLPAAAGRPILSRMLREATRNHAPSRRAVRTLTSDKKVGRDVVAHNLVVAPHPRILAQIKRAGQPVDMVLEAAARRAVEQMERKRGAKIIAVASTHLQDSSGVRPHLHIRMSSHDSAGKYIRLFDRKTGGSGGGRCILQNEIERQIQITIERTRSEKRD